MAASGAMVKQGLGAARGGVWFPVALGRPFPATPRSFCWIMAVRNLPLEIILVLAALPGGLANGGPGHLCFQVDSLFAECNTVLAGKLFYPIPF